MAMLMEIIPNIANIKKRNNYYVFKEIVRFIESYKKKRNWAKYMPSQEELVAYENYFLDSNKWI